MYMVDICACRGSLLLLHLSANVTSACHIHFLVAVLAESVSGCLRLAQTTFSQRGIQERGDTRGWTETPQQKLLRLSAAEQQRPQALEAAEQPHDSAAAQAVDAYNQSRRAKTLVEEHQERQKVQSCSGTQTIVYISCQRLVASGPPVASCPVVVCMITVYSVNIGSCRHTPLSALKAAINSLFRGGQASLVHCRRKSGRRRRGKQERSRSKAMLWQVAVMTPGILHCIHGGLLTETRTLVWAPGLQTRISSRSQLAI